MSIETLIKVNMPEGFESMNPEGIDVKLYSTTSGLTQASVTPPVSQHLTWNTVFTKQ